MRSISIVVLAAILVGVIPVQGAEGNNANTNTKTSLKNDLLLTDGVLTDYAKSEIAAEPQTDEVAVKKSPEEQKYDSTMARWKAKQAHLQAPKGKFTINASAYTAAADECGKSDGITASGVKVQEGRTLACPPNFAFGTKIRIEGVGVRVCEDRGGAIKGNHIDIYVKTKSEAFQFGRRNLEAEVVG